MLRNSHTNSIAHERAGGETAFTVHYLFFAWVHKSALFLASCSAPQASQPFVTPRLCFRFSLRSSARSIWSLSKARLHGTLRKQIYSILADTDLASVDLSSLERRLNAGLCG